MAMFGAMLPWCVHTAGSAIAGGEAPQSAAQRSLGGAAFYQVYETSDGKHVVLGGREKKFARNLLIALGHEDRIEEALRPAGEQDDLIKLLRSIFAQKMRSEWVEWFADKDVAFSPVLDFREAFDQPHIQGRSLLSEAENRHHIASPIRFAGAEKKNYGAVPKLGADG